jgi:hypothetical protein
VAAPGVVGERRQRRPIPPGGIVPLHK